MTINGVPFFHTQRQLFYAAMKWKQKYYKRAYDKVMLEVQLLALAFGVDYLAAGMQLKQAQVFENRIILIEDEQQ